MTDLSYTSHEDEQQKDLNLWKRIYGVFTAPGITFSKIIVHPKWFQPTLIIILFSLGMTVFLQPIIMKEQSQKQVEAFKKRGMSEEQIDEALTKGAKITKYIMYPSVIVATIVSILLGGAFWLFVSNVLLGGQAKFTQLASIHAFRMLIPTLGGLIKLPIILARETLNVHFSIATFMSDALKDTFLYRFLANIEMFNIWSITVLTIGIAVVTNKKVKSVWPWVTALYLIWFLITAGIGKLFG